MRWFISVVIVLTIISPSAEARGGGRSSGGGGIRYTRPAIDRNGTYRQGHYSTSPNNSKLDNWSSKNNVNPLTGKKGTKNP